MKLKSLHQLNDIEFDFVPNKKLLLSLMNDYLENENISNGLSLYFTCALNENGLKNIDLNVTNNLYQHMNILLSNHIIDMFDDDNIDNNNKLFEKCSNDFLSFVDSNYQQLTILTEIYKHQIDSFYQKCILYIIKGSIEYVEYIYQEIESHCMYINCYIQILTFFD